MQGQQQMSPQQQNAGEPFRVSFIPGGIEVSGRITSREGADELVAAIQALKLLLRPTETGARSVGDADDADEEAA